MNECAVEADLLDDAGRGRPAISTETLTALEHHISHALMERENCIGYQGGVRDHNSLLSIAFSLQCIRRMLCEQQWIDDVLDFSPWLPALQQFEENHKCPEAALELWDTVGSLGELKYALVALAKPTGE